MRPALHLSLPQPPQNALADQRGPLHLEADLQHEAPADHNQAGHSCPLNHLSHLKFTGRVTPPGSLYFGMHPRTIARMMVKGSASSHITRCFHT